MPKRQTEEEGVSLFPFLSILACVIGTLTLIISAIALGEMREDKDDLFKAENYEQTKKDVDARLAEIQDLKRQIAAEKTKRSDQANEKQKQLSDAQNRVNDLAQQIETAQKAAENAKVKIEIPTVDAKGHAETVKQLQDQLKKAKEQIAQLEKEIAERKLPPKESEVTILPSGSGVGFQPFFIECAAGSIVIHGQPKPERIRTPDVAKSEKFIDIMTEIVNSNNKSMVFLVRDDGLSTWRTVSKLANDKDVRNGKLPIIGRGRIDLSYFNKKK